MRRLFRRQELRFHAQHQESVSRALRICRKPGSCRHPERSPAGGRLYTHQPLLWHRLRPPSVHALADPFGRHLRALFRGSGAPRDQRHLCLPGAPCHQPGLCGAPVPGAQALSRRGGKADSAAPWLLHGRQHGARESDLLLDTEGQLLLL